MKYISTRGRAPTLNFEDTLLAGLAEDGGLYVPKKILLLPVQHLSDLRDQPYTETAYHMIKPFIGGAIDDARLRDIIEAAYSDFDDPQIAPLQKLEEGHYVLELFHGPTLAFKDFAMQLIARLMDEVLARRNERVTIIGATSGDTGGAAVEAFRGRACAELFMLFPHGRVSDRQRKQMTTASEDNVHALAIDGTFDDCQALVKAMFNDAEFRQAHKLTAVNSINWARIMAQTVYYATTINALESPSIAFSVPTGNFGDIFAGHIARHMGGVGTPLNIHRLIIATNANDILARVLESGVYEIGEVVATSSPSMDIQISSNFERLLFELYDNDATQLRALMDALATQKKFDLSPDALAKLRKGFAAARIDETETAATIKNTLRDHNIMLDPHSAVGVAAARKLRDTIPADIPIVSLATAHPAKFPDAVEAACGKRPEAPSRLARVLAREENYTRLPNDLATIQNFVKTKGEGG